MKSYYVVQLWRSLDPGQHQKNQEVSEQLGCAGIEEFSLEEAQVDSILGERSYCGGNLDSAQLKEIETAADTLQNWDRFYFCQEDAQKNAMTFVAYLMETGQRFIWSEEIEQDWGEISRAAFTLRYINPSLAIYPPWESAPANCPYSLVINPAMAFGTGEHETTGLCLKTLFNLRENSANKTVLDFGSGSGILGIAALKLGFSFADFYDIDAVAMENCSQNILANGFVVDRQCRLLLPAQRNLMNERSFDVVMANILLDVLTLERDYLIDRVASGGVLILSGILTGQMEQCRQFYLSSGKLDIYRQESEGEWGLVSFQKRV